MKRVTFAFIYAPIVVIIVVTAILFACALSNQDNQDPLVPDYNDVRDYHFDGEISRKVLENYLSRAITFEGLLMGYRSWEDNLRMIRNLGPKFIGRAICMWSEQGRIEWWLTLGDEIAGRIHEIDPEIIYQAAIFEHVTEEVNQIPIPEWVFKEFGLELEDRNFRYDDMAYPDPLYIGDGYIPDISQLETRMWFFYLAVVYIDIGVEAIHFGQVEIMDYRDPDHVYWREILSRVRNYASKHARRHLVLCDAHVPSGWGVKSVKKLEISSHRFFYDKIIK